VGACDELRAAFNRAAETFPASVRAYLDRTPAGRAEGDRLMAWWAQFYKAIVATSREPEEGARE
jgi:predicted dithiol-disulfide oxidoreductase (DUF899 family)